MNSPIDEIKNRLDIVEVISSYVKMQKAGVNYRALCPFHSEKTPSFFVSPARQIWRCFGGCGEGGDIFKFIMKIENVEFGDALRILAQKAGVELKKQSPDLKTKRQRLYEICEIATQFFEKQLKESKTGKEVKNYLLKRGISEDSIKRWRLGYNPDLPKALSGFLLQKNYHLKEIENSGLVVRNNSNNYFDRFRGRIIFPVFDLNSQVVGFGGRIFNDDKNADVAKYINTPNTLLYDKSRILYGLNFTKIDIRKKNECILVEGYTDVILLFQQGFKNVIASSGTSLTSEQLNIIKRYSDNILTAFDMDFAGDSATKRNIELAQSMGFNIKVVLLPEGFDPADMVLKDPEGLSKAIEQARSILDFYFENVFSKFDSKTPYGKKEISKVLLPLIKIIPNSIERAYWIQRLSKQLEVKEDDVVEELEKLKTKENSSYQLQEEKSYFVEEKKNSRKELLEERALLLSLKFPHLVNALGKEDKILLNSLKDKKESNKDYFDYLLFKAETEDFEEKEVLPEISFCIKEIQRLEIKNQLEKISQEIKEAEQVRNFKKVEELTKYFHNLTKKIQTA